MNFVWKMYNTMGVMVVVMGVRIKVVMCSQRLCAVSLCIFA